MQLAPVAMTSDFAPSAQVAQRFSDHFTAFGADEVITTGADEVTLKFDQKSGFEYMIATAAIKGAVDGVKLVFELADGANVPRMLPGAQHVVPTLAKLPGITGVTVAETFPEQVTLFADGRRSASDAVTLLNDTLPGGASIGVTVKDVKPNE